MIGHFAPICSTSFAIEKELSYSNLLQELVLKIDQHHPRHQSSQLHISVNCSDTLTCKNVRTMAPMREIVSAEISEAVVVDILAGSTQL